MATDMFGNVLSPEEEERLRLHQQRLGITPNAVPVAPSVYPNQAPAYGSFGATQSTGPYQTSPFMKWRQEEPTTAPFDTSEPAPMYGPGSDPRLGWKFNNDPIALNEALSKPSFTEPLNVLRQQATGVPANMSTVGLSFGPERQPAKPSPLYPDAIIRDAMLGMYDDMPDSSIVSDMPGIRYVDPYKGTLDDIPTAILDPDTQLRMLDNSMPNVEVNQPITTGIIPASSQAEGAVPDYSQMAQDWGDPAMMAGGEYGGSDYVSPETDQAYSSPDPDFVGYGPFSDRDFVAAKIADEITPRGLVHVSAPAGTTGKTVGDPFLDKYVGTRLGIPSTNVLDKSSAFASPTTRYAYGKKALGDPALRTIQPLVTTGKTLGIGYRPPGGKIGTANPVKAALGTDVAMSPADMNKAMRAWSSNLNPAASSEAKSLAAGVTPKGTITRNLVRALTSPLAAGISLAFHSSNAGDPFLDTPGYAEKYAADQQAQFDETRANELQAIDDLNRANALSVQASNVTSQPVYTGGDPMLEDYQSPVAVPAGPSAADIQRQKQADEQAMLARAAQRLQDDQAAQARQAALEKQVYAGLMSGRDRGEPSAREVQAAINAMQGNEFGGLLSLPGGSQRDFQGGLETGTGAYGFDPNY